MSLLCVGGAPSAWAQNTTNARCSAIFARSTSGAVTLNCGANNAVLKRIEASLNRIVQAGNLADPDIDALASAMNTLLDANTEGFSKVLARTDVLELKADRIQQLLESLVSRPQDARSTLTQASLTSISNVRQAGPFWAQIVNVIPGTETIPTGPYRRGYGYSNRLRFVLRLGPSETDQGTSYFGVLAEVIELSVGNQVGTIPSPMGWSVQGDKGTACRFRIAQPGMTIPHGADFGQLERAVASGGGSTRDLPLTMIVDAICPTIEREPVDVGIRLYYKPRTPDRPGTGTSWSYVTMHFGGVVPQGFDKPIERRRAR